MRAGSGSIARRCANTSSGGLEPPPLNGQVAQALAGECGANFISITGSYFSAKYYGVGIQKVKHLFELARKNALTIAAGHSFIIFLGDGFYPINVLNAIKMVPEVCRIFCATANPTEVVLAETEQGRGILGVVDGSRPRDVENEEGIAWRRSLLRKIGYKF